MKNIIKYIILFISINFAQESGLSTLNNTEKMLYYQSERLSPVQAIIYQATFPTLGYAYVNDWEKGFTSEVVRIISVAMAFHGFSFDKKNHYKSPSIGTLGLLTYFGVTIYQFIDVYKIAESYNNKLYKSMFGKEPPSVGIKLQPTYQGANLTMSYAFN